MSPAALVRIVAGCVALASPFGLTGPDTVSAARLAAQARERVLYANLVDSSTQQPVPDAGPDAFVVREDGARREVLSATRATSVMPIGIVVDNSQAMAPAIGDLRRGLTALVKGLEGIGPMSLITVADRPTIAQAYTTAQPEIVDAVNRVFYSPSGGATLLDAISDVAKGLAKRESDRAAIVVVTGEYTDFSHLQYPDVLADLRASGVQLHVVVLVNPSGSFANDEARNRATVLDRGPRESGGQRMDVLSSMSFEPRLKDLAAILTSQYRLVYVRPESLIPPQRIEVTSGKPKLEARGGPARGQTK